MVLSWSDLKDTFLKEAQAGPTDREALYVTVLLSTGQSLSFILQTLWKNNFNHVLHFSQFFLKCITSVNSVVKGGILTPTVQVKKLRH